MLWRLLLSVTAPEPRGDDKSLVLISLVERSMSSSTLSLILLGKSKSPANPSDTELTKGQEKQKCVCVCIDNNNRSQGKASHHLDLFPSLDEGLLVAENCHLDCALDVPAAQMPQLSICLFVYVCVCVCW